MPVYQHLSEEDHINISKALEALLTHGVTKRLDFNLSRGMEGSVYWAGTVIRLDIKGYDE